MSADDTFFNPSRGGAPAQLYLPHQTDDDSDLSADATFFGHHHQYAHPHPDDDEYLDDLDGGLSPEGLTDDSRAEVEAYRQQVRAEGRDYEDEEEYYEEQEEEMESFSEGSSAVFDPDADPAGFAERLDELAGIMEVGEEEARALRWGPSLGVEDTPLGIDEFKKVLNHHLQATEWRYEAHDGMEHPIGVLGPAWAGRRIAQEEEAFSGQLL